jgi:hypothetical protein
VAATVLLLPSPLLPPLAYESLAHAFRQHGWDCIVADPTGASSGTQLVNRWSATGPADAPVVAHSNAGYLAPGVRKRSGEPSRPVVFLDAALAPESGATSLAPPAFRTFLESLADPATGLLPPWTRWWPREEMAAVVPAALLDGIDQACPRLPVTYFGSTVHVPRGWTSAANAYLALGDTYLEELTRAKAGGWPTRRMAGSHLEFLHHPLDVAATVLDLFPLTSE